MTKIINPQTGTPFEKDITTEEIMHGLYGLNSKITAVGQQQAHFAMVLEYVINKLEASETVNLDMTEYKEWADKRQKEMRAEAEAYMKEMKQQQEDEQKKLVDSIKLTDE